MSKEDYIKQKIILQLELEIDDKVYEWMGQRQTKFKTNEKDKILEFSSDLIKFLTTLRPTDMPKNFRESTIGFIVAYKIQGALENIKQVEDEL